MDSPVGPPSVFRFGVFELDATSGELRKYGTALKIHPQPFRVLQLLAQHSGRVVTRDEIREYLWGNNTFVDFDRGINFCVNQIRAALADDAENPRYIETLPRRGYRFIASTPTGAPKHSQLFVPAPQSLAFSSSEHPKLAPGCADFPLQLDSPISVSVEVHPFGSRRNTRSLVAAVAAIAVVLAASFIFYLRFRIQTQLTEKDVVVLADFANTTGEPVFDESLRQALAVEIGQSPFLNVLSDKRASETLRMMGRPMTQRVTIDVGRDICQRTGSKAILTGSISSLGKHYLLEVNAIACGSGDNLASEQVEAGSKEDILKSLSRAASTVRVKLGESLPSVRKFDVPVEATTSSLEALQMYSIGLNVLKEQGESPSIPFLKRALELDPNFALAYAGLAARYNNLNQPSVALEYATKAYELRGGVTERERLVIAARYFRLTGDLIKSTQTFKLWMAEYPHDYSPHGSLAGNYVFLGQYDKALAERLEELRLGPDQVAVYENLTAIYLALGRLDEAKATVEQALNRKLDSGGLRWMMYYLAFLRKDSPLMQEQVAWSTGRPGDEATLLSAQSDTEAFYGQLRKARDFSRRAVDAAVRSDNKEAAALWQASAALREAEFGNNGVAKREAMGALLLDRGRNVKMFAGLALARIGETLQGEKLVEELEKSDPSNTILRLYRLPVSRAAIELKRGHASQAVRLLDVAAPYELGEPSLSPLATLYPVYLRGQGYLLDRNGEAAVTEFQKLLNHPGIALNSPLGVLARLQLARAYVMERDLPQAEAAYKDFLTLWRDADADIPIYKQAKAEYAKLQ